MSTLTNQEIKDILAKEFEKVNQSLTELKLGKKGLDVDIKTLVTIKTRIKVMFLALITFKT